MSKIAIRIPNWIGDAVLATPFVRQTRKIFKKEEIFLILRPAVLDVYRNNPCADEIIVLEDRKNGLIASARFLKGYGFDIYFNLPRSFSSGLICYLSRAKERYGFIDNAGILFFQKLVNQKELGRFHRAVQYLMLLKGFSPRLKELRPEIFLSAAESREGARILSSRHLKKPVVGINPNSSAPSRRWMPDRFARLADTLMEKKRVSVLFFGSAAERPAVDSIISLMRRKPVNLAGEIGLRQYMGVLRHLSLFITNDSGPMHLANACGAPVLALEGAADTRETGLLGKTRHAYVNKNAACSPCVKNTCSREMECMKAIETTDVLKAADALLRKRHGHG